MSKPARCAPTITCKCVQCKNEFTFRSVGQVNNAKRKFCGNQCAATWRNTQPGRIEAFNRWIGRGWTKGRKSPESSARMRSNNPMSNPVTREKMRQSLKGRTFLARGGKGKPTAPQLALSAALNLPIEHPIKTRLVRHLFKSLPNFYLVDLAHIPSQTAIEVDGKTHRQPLWKFLDHRKTEVLIALGWSVLRFTNEQVTNDLNAVVSSVRRSIASK